MGEVRQEAWFRGTSNLLYYFFNFLFIIPDEGVVSPGRKANPANIVLPHPSVLHPFVGHGGMGGGLSVDIRRGGGVANSTFATRSFGAVA